MAIYNNFKGAKRAVEKILVVKGNETLPTDGTPLTDPATLDVNLNDGQVGLLDVTPGSSTFNQFINNAGSLTFNDVPVIKIVQGTNKSSDPGSANVPFTKRPYETSVEIIGKNVVAYTGKKYAGGKRSASVLAPSATPQELAKYSIYLGFRGRRVTEFDAGIHAVVKKKVEYNTPEYSTLGYTSDTDDLVQNLVYQLDQNSQQFQPFFGNFGGSWKEIAFAVDVSGGSGTAISAITAGTSVPVIVTPDGITRSVVFDQEMVDTLADVVANTPLTTSSTIELVDLSTSGSGTSDYILIMAMNEIPAYIDRDPTLKIRIDCGAGDRFEDEGLNFSVGCNPFEGQGTYRQWKIYWDNTNGQRAYSQNRDLYPVLVYPTSLVDGETYDALILEHYSSSQVQFTGTSNSPYKTIVLIPNTGTGKAAILDGLNDWLSPSFPPVSL
jgi:hypothetical protein